MKHDKQLHFIANKTEVKTVCFFVENHRSESVK